MNMKVFLPAFLRVKIDFEIKKNQSHNSDQDEIFDV
jgi:hypothetical protein